MMNLYLILVAVLVVSASAFVTAPKKAFDTKLCAAQQSRQEFFNQAAAAVVAGSATLLSSPTPAQAYKYGPVGSDSPGVLDPALAEIDEEILKSGAVQDAVRKIQRYQNVVQQMKKGVEKDAQANLAFVIKQELEASDVRTNLYTFNTCFEEDTQRGTDRLIRGVIQDIVELDAANKQKEGVLRSDIRLEAVKRKLDKLEKAFGDLLAFAKV